MNNQAVGFPRAQQAALIGALGQRALHQLQKAVVNEVTQTFKRGRSQVVPGSARDWNNKVNERKRAKKKKKMPNAKSSSSKGSNTGRAVPSYSSSRVRLLSKKKRKRRVKRRRYKKSNKKLARLVRRLAKQQTGPLFSWRACITATHGNNVNSVSYLDMLAGRDADMATIAALYGKQITSAGAVETISWDDADAYNAKLKGRLTSIIQIRNNASHSAELDIYYVVPKLQTSSAPTTHITNGLDEFGIGDTGYETSLCYYPSDSSLFRSTWKIVKQNRIVLEPGASCENTCSRKIFWHNSYAQSHALAYQPRHTLNCVIRVRGTLEHSQADSGVVGLSKTDIDIFQRLKYDVRGIGEHNAIPHTTQYDSVGTVTTGTQFQRAAPSEETFNT